MNYLCFDCTAEFVAECFAAGLTLKGVEYVAESDSRECDRCGKSLPESDELEQQSKLLLMRTLTVMRDRVSRSIHVLEGNG
jgi:DNA-directed RNA polymerase subunit RPC12/RpoP